jgi:predicted aconitase
MKTPQNTNRYMTDLVFTSSDSRLIVDNAGWLGCPKCSHADFVQLMLWVTRWRKRQRAIVVCVNCQEEIKIELQRDGWVWISHARQQKETKRRGLWARLRRWFMLWTE